MSGVDLIALYSQATNEAFRLEAQQRYAVSAEAAQLRAYEEGRPLPPDPHVGKSMEIIRAAVARGVRVHRVHVVDLPLSAYMRYEIAAYEENIAAGEQVGIAVRAWHTSLSVLTEDFVLFDAATSHQAVVWMRYDQKGRLASREYSNSTDDIAWARRCGDIAIAHAVSLHEFAALPEAG